MLDEPMIPTRCLDTVKEQAVIDWLLARKPWALNQQQDENDNDIFSAKCRSHISDRILECGFIFTKAMKDNPRGSEHLEFMKDTLHKSMAQALACEGQDPAYDEYFTTP